MVLVKVRIYCDSEKFYQEGLLEKQQALTLTKIPIADVVDLEMFPIIEGELMKESGKIKTKYCCVNSRETHRLNFLNTNLIT